MSGSSQQQAEFQILLVTLTESGLTDDQFEKLRQILTDDPRLRSDYHHQLQMHSLLLFDHKPSSIPGQQFTSPEAFADFVRQASDQAGWQTELQQDAATFGHPDSQISLGAGQPLQPPAPPAVLSGPGYDDLDDGGWATGIRQMRDWTIGHWQFLAVAVSTTCLLGLFLWGRENVAPVQDGDPRPPVVNSLQNDAGTVTLALNRIGTVTIDGPTDFRMVGPLRARLNYGRIDVHVSEESGRGFVVETPDGDVTDFGTKFSLNVSKGSDTKLIVREGAVDLRPGTWREPGINDRRERLIGGEAVSFNAAGSIQRLMSIIADEPDEDNGQSKPAEVYSTPLITSVRDNLTCAETKGYYQIVPRGLRDDALSNVGARHQWNGVDANGIPAYLLGADYVKSYVREKYRKTNVSVTLSRPAKLYLFWCDERETPHDWLVREFRPTGDFIGLDANDGPGKHGRKARARGHGPGKSIDLIFSIWVREITTPGTVELGAGVDPSRTGSYGIAATELETETTPVMREEELR